jgi:hypothetical protein
MNELTTLFDEAKPYARFYESEGGLIAQVHTRRIEGLGFGRIGWRITASCSDQSGATLIDAAGLQILKSPGGQNASHEVVFQADSVPDVAAELEAGRRMMAQKAFNAAEVWQAANELT